MAVDQLANEVVVLCLFLISSRHAFRILWQSAKVIAVQEEDVPSPVRYQHSIESGVLVLEVCSVDVADFLPVFARKWSEKIADCTYYW